MISYIRGIYTDIDESGVVIEAGGVGYYIYTPVGVLSKLPPMGSELKLYTYMKTGEDGVFLYGFLEKEELIFFKKLILVNGVGPKAGMSILSSMGVRELTIAIIGDDDKAISKAPGVGSKTAKRIIMELKDKIDVSDLSGAEDMSKFADVMKEYESGDVTSEAAMALEALGYTKSEALKALSHIEKSDDMSTNDMITQALRII